MTGKLAANELPKHTLPDPAKQLGPYHTFADRHIGPSNDDIAAMLEAVGCESLEALIDDTVPADIRLERPLRLPEPAGEREALEELRRIAARNRVCRSLIGMGYHDCITPPVILRNILENPGWYTQYTPYQAEIAQGRLEALLNFQTMVADLTGLPLANASLLDEATAAAEAMTMCRRISKSKSDVFFVAADCHPQTIAVLSTRARPLGIELHIAEPGTFDFDNGGAFGVLLQYPTSDGRICDYSDTIEKAHAAGGLVVMAADLLALTLIKPPGEWGADIAVGSAQRFGVPLGAGGPHPAFIATHEKHARQVPGRIVGVSKDAGGDPAYRLSVQTREQHIRRDRATSNICTAQVLLAIMAGMYAVYHGPKGLRRIAQRVRAMTWALAEALASLDCRRIGRNSFFDTIRIKPSARLGTAREVAARLAQDGFNVREFEDETLGLTLDETTTIEDIDRIAKVFGARDTSRTSQFEQADVPLPDWLERDSDYLTHDVFNSFHAEHEMLRYITRLQSRDLSLTTSMIPLGSCTMKLNAVSEMLPVTWPEFADIHPYAPADQTAGYAELFEQLERWLAEMTGFAAVSLQPNAGAQGEYAGLLAIRAYHESRGEAHRDVCLIPVSAHGTNPASAVMAGCRVVTVTCDKHGNVDVSDLRGKVDEHREKLAALMITYPSTHGVFEPRVREVCEIVHAAGGQVYMDGANLNAQLGLTRPGDIGADVCHLNLHKTFCIPHGGGGPGMGPIGVAEHLVPFLPGHPLDQSRDRKGAFGVGPVSAAPYGSPSILPISWMYIRMMGEPGLKKATQVAILSANYMATRLEDHYDLVYKGLTGRVAHEFIIDLRPFKKSADIDPDDVAKRLMDYGFHAPTMSFPVAGTLMIEPTESESKAELDRFCEALIAIREEIRAIEQARMHREDNPLKRAPHTAADVTADVWERPYSRAQGAYPAAWLRRHKFWPPVGRIDNVYGDRHLFCSCPPMGVSEDDG